MKTFKIYRGIGIEDDGINIDSVGISWTLEIMFAEKRASDMVGIDFEGKNLNRSLVMSASVSDDMIDWPATLGQLNGDFQSEYEVILLPNASLDFEIIQDEEADYLCIDSLEGDYEGNTGNGVYDETMAAYCEDDEVEELKERFIEIASEF